MSESLKDVINKLKANAQAQQVKPAPAPIPDPIEDEMDEDDEIVEETPKETKQDPKQEQKVDIREQIAMEIEMLQNNGRFRVELLHQLQEINKALVVIASCLADGEK